MKVPFAVGACVVIVVAQVILPAAVDLILSLGLIGAGVWVGFQLNSKE